MYFLSTYDIFLSAIKYFINKKSNKLIKVKFEERAVSEMFLVLDVVSFKNFPLSETYKMFQND